MNDREKLIELLKAKYDHYCDRCGVNKQTEYIENLADYLIANGVTVQKYGRWIKRYLDGEDMSGKPCEIMYACSCSECGLNGEIPTRFCPNCGAKMGGE